MIAAAQLLITGALLAVLVIGDTATAAAIAGAFSCANTVLSAWLLRRLGRTEQAVHDTHRVLAAPRRAVYDAEGRVIGTVVRLETDDGAPPKLVPIPPQRGSDLPQRRRRGDGHDDPGHDDPVPP